MLVISQVQFSHYKDYPLKLAVTLVNSEDVLAGADTLDVSAVQALINRSDLDRTSKVRPSHLEAMRRLRTQVRAVFESASVDQAATGINAILRGAGATPFVGLHGEGPHLHVAPDEKTPAGWLGATIGMGLAELVVHYGTDRFGVCSANDCRDVFIDVSRNHSRKHCSARCTNREGVRSFRRRQSAS
ncbi:MAG: CGNR zinc finger domain-containing protein [Acidimicrobiia bacterium]|nr:CGNR zinc finger domain-containing protein [Acidimicrobiia bacterium]